MRRKLMKRTLITSLLASTFVIAPFSVAYAEDEVDTEINETENEIPNGILPSNEGSNEEEEEVQIDTPASVTGQTMEGSGTVVDFQTTGAKAFYTIVDNEQQVFYLIIDLDKTENNVYFLSDINKTDLGAGEATPATPATADAATTDQMDMDTIESAQAEEPENEGGNGFLIAVLLIAGIGLAAYYFLVMKKRHQKNSNEDEESEEMSEEYEDDFYHDGSKGTQ